MCPFTVRVPPGWSLAGFLGGMVTCALGAPRRACRTIGVRILPWICLRQSAPTPFNRLFRLSAAVSRPRHRVTPGGSTGILTGSAIGLAWRLSLRSRLTLIRLTLIRKPLSFGEGVSRPLYRYLYLHLLFQKLQQGSAPCLPRRWNAPLPSFDPLLR